ncbi:MAG TPA: FeoC-like transcriptional regulator [Methanomassiliicoccaceae archaeon]|jgi:predicted ArsR family transcriptional regulator|nr:hypothetical protein [Euryarchaeota archaeon]HOB38684.1 FeoC-like transcriptional regulator [Methanomassiliicoccaceae archaeon]HQA21443.1 FeoC-like transcriptional regulator [Methanomassiliicoccaceae archaeon]HQD88486.1 FeoC-like transcriptional regulator [Methanomassiliicoccaceae archaeon]
MIRELLEAMAASSSIDDISRRLELDPDDVRQRLLFLEVKGLVQKVEAVGCWRACAGCGCCKDGRVDATVVYEMTDRGRRMLDRVPVER